MLIKARLITNYCTNWIISCFFTADNIREQPLSLNLNCLNHYFPLFSALPNSCTIKFSLLILNHIKMCIMRGSLSFNIFPLCFMFIYWSQGTPTYFSRFKRKKRQKVYKTWFKNCHHYFYYFPFVCCMQLLCIFLIFSISFRYIFLLFSSRRSIFASVIVFV